MLDELARECCRLTRLRLSKSVVLKLSAIVTLGSAEIDDHYPSPPIPVQLCEIKGKKNIRIYHFPYNAFYTDKLLLLKE